MVYFNLNLTSRKLTFDFFPQTFLDKNYEVILLKLDGSLEINKKININWTNNTFYYVIYVRFYLSKKYGSKFFVDSDLRVHTLHNKVF
jgi:hypothetical protein